MVSSTEGGHASHLQYRGPLPNPCPCVPPPRLPSRWAKGCAPGFSRFFLNLQSSPFRDGSTSFPQCRRHVRPWIPFGYGAPRWRLLRLLVLPLLWYCLHLRTPRSTQRPLTLPRSRGDRGDGVLTGATRRLRSVRFGVHSFLRNELLVLLFFFFKKKYLRPGRVPHLSPDGERSSTVSRLRGMVRLRRLLDTRSQWNRTVRMKLWRTVSPSMSQPTGSRFEDTPLVVPTREHVDLVKRLMVGDTYIGRGSRQRNLPKSRFSNIYKVSQHGWSSAITQFRLHFERTQDFRGSINTFWMPITVSLHESATLPCRRVDK